MRPAGVVVSMACWSRYRSTLAASSERSVSIRSAKRAAQAIHRPNHDHIEATTRGIPQHRIQAWPLVPTLGTADAVVVIGCHHGPAALGGDSFERPALVFGGLAVCADPEVEGGALRFLDHQGLRLRCRALC